MYLITELNIALTSCGLNIKWTIHASADGLIMFLLDKSVSVHRALTRLSNRDWHWDCQTVRYWENSSQIRESKIVNHVMSMSLLLLSIFVWVCLDEKKRIVFFSQPECCVDRGREECPCPLLGRIVSLFRESGTTQGRADDDTSGGRRQTELQWLEHRNSSHLTP